MKKKKGIFPLPYKFPYTIKHYPEDIDTYENYQFINNNESLIYLYNVRFNSLYDLCVIFDTKIIAKNIKSIEEAKNFIEDYEN